MSRVDEYSWTDHYFLCVAHQMRGSFCKTAPPSFYWWSAGNMGIIIPIHSLYMIFSYSLLTASKYSDKFVHYFHVCAPVSFCWENLGEFQFGTLESLQGSPGTRFGAQLKHLHFAMYPDVLNGLPTVYVKNPARL